MTKIHSNLKERCRTCEDAAAKAADRLIEKFAKYPGIVENLKILRSKIFHDPASILETTVSAMQDPVDGVILCENLDDILDLQLNVQHIVVYKRLLAALTSSHFNATQKEGKS
jgi:hypothetical protein